MRKLIYTIILMVCILQPQVFAQENVNSESIIINEVFANPANETFEEFIEIYNNTDTEYDLLDFYIQDSAVSDNLVDIDLDIEQELKGTILYPKSYALIVDRDVISHVDESIALIDEISKISDKVIIVTTDDTTIGNGLGNNSDKIEILNLDDRIINMVSWEITKENISYERDNLGAYFFNPCDSLSPGRQNDSQIEDKCLNSNKVYSDIIINEVMYSDNEQWIEIYNNADQSVNLSDLELFVDDQKFSLYNLMIPAKEYTLINYPEYNLNMTSESIIQLIYNEDEIIYEVGLIEIPIENSLALDQGIWTSTEKPTPGLANVIIDTPIDDNITSKEYISIYEAKRIEKNKVNIEGIVTVDPELLGKNTFYIQDDSAGIQVYSKFKIECKLSNKIRITGEISSFHDEKRITVENYEVLDNNTAINPVEIISNQLNEDNEGKLIKVSGELIKSTGDTFYLKDTAGEMKIQIKSTTKAGTVKRSKGKVYSVSGILSQYGKNKDGSANYRILPRYASDITSEESLNSLAHTGDNLIEIFLIGLFTTLTSLIVVYKFCLQKIYKARLPRSSIFMQSFNSNTPILSRFNERSVPPAPS